MQEYIDIVFANWFILLPAIVVFVIVVWLLIKKGYLQSMDLFGLKLSFSSSSDDSTSSKYIGKKTLKNYHTQFTKAALANIKSLGITEDKVIQLIEHEFIHHTNYFFWDLQDYPLPVQQNYIVVLDKIDKSLNIRAVKLSDFNEAELTSINNLLTDYRRLGRYKYRTDKDYVLRQETVKKIIDAHHQIIKRLLRHYEKYKDSSYDAGDFIPLYLNYEYLIEKSASDSINVSEYQSKLEKYIPKDETFAYNIISSVKSLDGIGDVFSDLDNGLISSEVADQETVLSLERSLQYIHKSVNILFDQHSFN
jgi:hypothetical protein